MAQSQSSAGTPSASLVEDLDTAFQDFSARCDRMLSGGAASSLSELQANESALYRVLMRLDRLTASDYAASREAEGRAEQLVADSGPGAHVFLASAPSPSRRLIAWLVAIVASRADQGR